MRAANLDFCHNTILDLRLLVAWHKVYMATLSTSCCSPGERKALRFLTLCFFLLPFFPSSPASSAQVKEKKKKGKRKWEEQIRSASTASQLAGIGERMFMTGKGRCCSCFIVLLPALTYVLTHT